MQVVQHNQSRHALHSLSQLHVGFIYQQMATETAGIGIRISTVLISSHSGSGLMGYLAVYLHGLLTLVQHAAGSVTGTGLLA